MFGRGTGTANSSVTDGGAGLKRRKKRFAEVAG